MTTHVKPVSASIIVPFVPVYREGLAAVLDADPRVSITWCADAQDGLGSQIPTVSPEKLSSFRMMPVRKYARALVWQRTLLGYALRSRDAVYIFNGDPHYIATWAASALLRLRGKRVMFWTHGWRTSPRGLNRAIRHSFYRLSHSLLLYGRRAYNIGRAAGYPADRMAVIFNSVVPVSKVAHPPARDRDRSKQQHWITLSRLTRQKKYDELLQALAVLTASGKAVRLTMIGDGPDRARLEELARSLQLDVRFYGANYDERETARWLMKSDICVSPGNVGLTAIHALANGCPVATHDDPSRQGPEMEAIVDGVTGVLFPHGDSLAMVERAWAFVAATSAQQVASSCLREVEECWTPARQAESMIREIVR